MLLEITYNQIRALVVETLEMILTEAFQPYETFLPFNAKFKVMSQHEASMVNIINKESRMLIKQGKEDEARQLISTFMQTRKLPPNIMAKYGIRSVGRPKGSVSVKPTQPVVKRGRVKGSSNFATIYQNSIPLKASTGQKALIATEIPGIKHDPTHVHQYMDDFIYDNFLKEILNFMKKPNNQPLIDLYNSEDSNPFNVLSTTCRKIKDLLEQFRYTASDVKQPESPYDLLATIAPYVKELANAIRELAFTTTALKKQHYIKNNMLDQSIAMTAGRHAVISFNKLVILDERTSMQYASVLDQKADYMQTQGKNSMIKRDIPPFKIRKK